MTTTAILIGVALLGALGAGILVGRYYVPDDRALKRTARHAQIYLRALNELLARDRDRAIDELVRAVGEDVADLEPYFALGALFRGRGEWERAIRVHQGIEMRAKGDRKVRRRARFELGLDFRTAGMPRRAIRAMEECLAEAPKHGAALRALCGLYEQQGRYADAAAAWRRLGKLTGEASPREPHLWAAAARAAAREGDAAAAKGHLREAEKTGAGIPHVLAAGAEVALVRAHARQASERFAKVIEAAPGLARMAVDGIREAERARLGSGGTAGDVAEGALARLEGLSEAAAEHFDVGLAAAELRVATNRGEALAQYGALARAHPEQLAARLPAARAALASGDAAAVRAELEALVAEDGPLATTAGARWRCGFCGAERARFAWWCDGCRQWGRAAPPSDRPLAEPPAARDRRAEQRSPAPTGAEPPAGDGAAAGDGSALARAGAWMSGAARALRRKRTADERATED